MILCAANKEFCDKAKHGVVESDVIMTFSVVRLRARLEHVFRNGERFLDNCETVNIGRRRFVLMTKRVLT